MSYTVIKRSADGEDILRYQGDIIEQTTESICLKAIFNHADYDLGYMTMNRGDVFIEWFYRNRWYNVFRVIDGKTGVFKGWYCNITRPAVIESEWLAADDLALDIFVHPVTRTLLLLDEDEYHALNLSEAERREVQNALDEIHHLVTAGESPFDADSP